MARVQTWLQKMGVPGQTSLAMRSLLGFLIQISTGLMSALVPHL